MYMRNKDDFPAPSNIIELIRLNPKYQKAVQNCRVIPQRIAKISQLALPAPPDPEKEKNELERRENAIKAIKEKYKQPEPKEKTEEEWRENYERVMEECRKAGMLTEEGE